MNRRKTAPEVSGEAAQTASQQHVEAHVFFKAFHPQEFVSYLRDLAKVMPSLLDNMASSDQEAVKQVMVELSDTVLPRVEARRATALADVSEEARLSLQTLWAFNSSSSGYEVLPAPSRTVGTY